MINSNSELKQKTALLSETTRKWMVSLVFLVYWLLIFEGAIRKWLLPGFNKYVFFIRDPFVIAIYLLFLTSKFRIERTRLFVFAQTLFMISIPLAFFHLAILRVPLLLLVYGWRNYFLYLFLPFIIAKIFREDDLNGVIRHTLYLSVPIAILTFFQVLAPPDDVINQGFGGEGNAFSSMMAGSIVRAGGTFSSSAGQALFIGSCIAMMLYCWLLPASKRPVSFFTLVISTGAVFVNLAVSGSRGAFGQAFVVAFFALGASLILPSLVQKFRNTIITFFLVGVAVIVLPQFFSFQLGELYERAVGAASADGIDRMAGADFVPRILASFIDPFLYDFPVAPILGNGLGLAGNAATILGYSAAGAEGDWGRHFFELGQILGLVYIAFRILLSIFFVQGALDVVKQSKNIFPMILVGFVFLPVIQGQITGQGSVHGYGWLFSGFMLASIKIYSAKSEDDLSPEVMKVPMVISERKS